MSARACVVCLNKEGNQPFVAREMMFGMRDEFDYFECGRCGCLQVANLPEGLSRYYPQDYYSFQDDAPVEKPYHRGALRNFLVRRYLRTKLGFLDPLGALLLRLRPSWQLPDWLLGQRLDLNFDSAILDVGCGSGAMLCSLWPLGFRNLHGVDPYIPADIDYGPGLRIRKGHLEDVSGTFDLITFHHAFEHVPRPRETIQAAAARLRSGGTLLLRVPLAGTYAWKHYGPNWVQLDAPRHLFVPTARSIAVLAELTGLEVRRTVHHSTGFAFWGSEQYVRDIPLRGSRSVFNDPPYGTFTQAEMDDFEQKARALNASHDADQAGFYLHKPSDS